MTSIQSPSLAPDHGLLWYSAGEAMLSAFLMSSLYFVQTHDLDACINDHEQEKWIILQNTLLHHKILQASKAWQCSFSGLNRHHWINWGSDPPYRVDCSPALSNMNTFSVVFIFLWFYVYFWPNFWVFLTSSRLNRRIYFFRKLSNVIIRHLFTLISRK